MLSIDVTSSFTHMSLIDTIQFVVVSPVHNNNNVRITTDSFRELFEVHVQSAVPINEDIYRQDANVHVGSTVYHILADLFASVINTCQRKEIFTILHIVNIFWAFDLNHNAGELAKQFCDVQDFV